MNKTIEIVSLRHVRGPNLWTYWPVLEAIVEEYLPSTLRGYLAVTDRRHPQAISQTTESLRLLTAHCRDGVDTLDWEALAQEQQTLAVYMGVAGLERLREFISRSPPGAGELGALIREDVRRHADGRPQNDDITLMVFGRTL